MLLQPFDRTADRWEPQGLHLLRLHAVQVGTPAIVTADLVVPGMSAWDVIERRWQFTLHAVLVALDLLLITVPLAYTDENNRS